MRTFKLGGIHPADQKLSVGKATQQVPLPDMAIVSLDQHIGAPVETVVAVGDTVKVGQLLAKAGGAVSANIHCPVSGIVKKIDVATDNWGNRRPAVYIQREGDDWLEGIDPSDTLIRECTLSPEEILQKIADAGIVGLGGACFPTHVKLTPPANCPIDTLLVNAVECEPYLTHNHQLMLEKPEEILVGTRILLQALRIHKAIIGIEANKPDAIANLEELLQNDSQISVMELQMKYPQGGEKQLIQACTGRLVKSGAIPASVGVVVQNVATVFAVYEAVQKNKPLLEVMMTVSGEEVASPGNFKVRIGTPMTTVLEMVGGIPENTGKVIGGGPMMGRALSHLEAPVTKRTSGIVCMPEKHSHRKPVATCIRCGHCIEVCPMGLEPYLLATLGQLHRWDEAETARVTDCLECGCCLYCCPGDQPLLDFIRIGKAHVMATIKARQAAQKK